MAKIRINSSMPNDQAYQNFESKQKKPNKFLLKVYSIISDSKNSQVISWTDSGDSFEIKNTSLFTKNLLPKYFKHKKFASFISQLNMYDFSKCKNSEFTYSHPLFRKGLKQELGKIRRKVSEKKLNKRESIENPFGELKTKFKGIKSKQGRLMAQIEDLLENCRGVAYCNESLLGQIQEYKMREECIFNILEQFSERFREVPNFLLKFYQNLSSQIEVPIPVPISHVALISNRMKGEE